MEISQRIKAFQSLLQKHQLDAFIIPSNDPHQSEYVAPHWKSREWLSNFTGSAGTLIITPTEAGLWTDSRYFLQAETELQGTGINFHKQKVPHAPEHIQWLADNLKAGSRIGVDGYLFSAGQINYINKQIQHKAMSIHYDLPEDLMDQVWEDRPALPDALIFEHDVAFAGQSRSEKLAQLQQVIRDHGAHYMLISTLDDIAWTLNIRGRDVEFNPVAISYLLVGLEQSLLFINPQKIEESLTTNLKTDQVHIQGYDQLEVVLSNLQAFQKVVLDPRSTSIRIQKSIPEEQIVKGANTPRQLKAVKNDVEIKHLKHAMCKDGVALTKLYRWIDQELDSRTLPEAEVAAKLANLRAQQADYFGESFSAIVGYKGNGAIVHYRPDPKTSAEIAKAGILLLDSGGQFLDGTTDLTRTIALGEPTAEQKKHFTLVLKGHIALATIQFPTGTTGMQLDTLARMHLWKSGLNYGHGTGHGVGFFLNVHEPPQGFASNPSTSRGSSTFEVGMLTSNEPGFYLTDQYGIRIENLVLCVPGIENEFGSFLKFETVSWFPIDQQLIDQHLLTSEELDWLNQYHQQVYENLAPLLDEEEQKWMEEKCKVM